MLYIPIIMHVIPAVQSSFDLVVVIIIIIIMIIIIIITK